MFPIFAGNSASTGYNLTRSLRFRSSASAYLNRTLTTPTSSTKFTWSGWVKRGKLDASNLQGIFCPYSSGTVYGYLAWYQDGLRIFDRLSGGTNYLLQTTAVYRDPSSWYHIVYAVDTTQATAANRIRLYVNGVEITAFSTATYPTQNNSTTTNSAIAHNIGYDPSNTAYFDGYLAENNFVDGQQLTPSSFGSTNALTGVWQPARYTGTYGTNGFYLPFTYNSAATYAGSFNGSSQYLNFTGNSTLNFGTGDFTIEAWVNGPTQAAYAGIAGSSLTPSGWTFRLNNSGQLIITNGGVSYTSTLTVPINSWNHVAVTRSGTSLRFFVNGILSNTASSSDSVDLTSGTFQIAKGFLVDGANGYFSGSMSNLRIVKGTAVYTASFTPSTTALTAISGTSLLTLQDATIIDNSTNAFTITNNGTVTTSVASPFATVSNVTADQSGNGNSWTPNNISLSTGVTYDSMTDVPTLTSATAANFAVLNPLDYSNGAPINGNLVLSNSASTNYYGARATFGLSSGKWYWEQTIVTLSTQNASNAQIDGGVCLSTYTLSSGIGSAGCWGFQNSNGSATNSWKFDNGTGTNSFTVFGAGDIAGFALDMGAGTLAVYRNNTLQFTCSTSLAGNTVFPVGWAYAASGQSASCAINFGQQPFNYTPPTGFVALNTYNLPTSTIVKGNTVMDATLYTGTGAAQSIVNAAAFKPDLVWFKCRSIAYNNNLFDSVRGAGQDLRSNLTNAESTTSEFTSFNSNGWSFSGVTTNGFNDNGATYVGWQWQAGQGSTSSNTNGTITSTVSVNASAGFSVVTYTGTNTATNTVGHGLGVAPAVWLIKNRTTAGGNWVYNFIYNGAVTYLFLNSTNAGAAQGSPWSTSPTSSVVTLGGSDTNTCAAANNYVMYAWTPIAGYSAFGSYTGNGSTDGPFTYVGFRPKFVLIKRTDSTGDWCMYDTSRNPSNVVDIQLFANTAQSESGIGSGNFLDILSNGFKNRNAATDKNASGGTYIYMAFAENPFKNSLAR